MAKGSMSGASTNVAKGGSGAAGTVSKAAARQSSGGGSSRRPRATKSTGGAIMGTGGGGLLRFYANDAPGLKIGPVTVLAASVIYISCVILLHIYGKLTR
eukprot:TRINITY_DN586_c0_g1_i3.p2 TRINITY_DN586_c0_g1~~TRINITY_DN586_c0_g1_i3.p2  ORF type:complete len:100 (-),score=19.13 TRINITY_DN586_c0_g1_i3:571-870(-)